MDVTAAVLFGKARQAVLTLLLEQPARTFYLREMSRLTGIGPGALQHELGQLLQADLVLRAKDGNRVAYQANAAHPVFAELQSLVGKTCGLQVQLKAALQPHAAQIRFAAIYGSLAKGTNHARSDVDLLLVGELGLEQALAAITPLEESIGREISVRLYSPKEFHQRRAKKDGFIQGVMAGPITVVLGNVDDA
jgi:predicted nucleotidyltransferase